VSTKTMTPKTTLVQCPCPRCYLGYHDQPKLAERYRKHAEWRERAEKAEAEVEKLCRELAEARSLIIEGKKLHDFIRKLLSFVYMEMPAHDNTKKFVQQYFNEIQS